MKKGFTLVEVIAVVVILGLLALIAIPSYMKAAAAVKNSNLNNIQTMITSSMLNYANLHYIDEIKPSNNTCSSNNCCKYYSIEYIKQNRIFQTTNGKITNPVTNEELEGYIKVSYDTTKLELTAEYKENTNDIGNCNIVDSNEGE